MKKRVLSMVLASVMAFSLAACGGTSKKSETTGKNDGEGKTWIVATDTVFQPFEYTNEKGEFVGIDVELLKAIADDQNFNYELQSLGWDGAVAAVQAGQADAIIAGATIKQERIDSGWIFSDGYYEASQTVVVPENSDIKSLDDLKGANVAVKNGTAGADYANQLKDKYNLKITVFEDSPTMYQDVLAGNSAACFEDVPIILSNIKEKGLALKTLEGAENEASSYGLAIMDEANQEFIDMFNKGLANIKANGTYDQIIEKYLGEQ